MNTKQTIIMSVVVIAVLAGAIIPLSSSFAVTNTTQNQNQTPDVPDQGTQTDTVDKDNVQNDAVNDGETNDDQTSASEGPNGDGDGEQKDSTESGK